VEYDLVVQKPGEELVSRGSSCPAESKRRTVTRPSPRQFLFGQIAKVWSAQAKNLHVEKF
jgi:hypothetical protein